MFDLSKFQSDAEVKNIICEIGRRMYLRGYVAANDGNITIRSGINEVWATPTGVSKGYMAPDMLVKLDMEGNVIEGSYKPSTEIKMHLRVYKENPEIKTVVHAHPPIATSFAIAGISLDKPILAEAILTFGTVPVVPYATPGTSEIPEAIAAFCRNYTAVLLANHGALTWGRDPQEAYFKMESLEHYAQILMFTDKILNKANELTTTQIDNLMAIRKTIK